MDGCTKQNTEKQLDNHIHRPQEGLSVPLGRITGQISNSETCLPPLFKHRLRSNQWESNHRIRATERQKKLTKSSSFSLHLAFPSNMPFQFPFLIPFHVCYSSPTGWPIHLCGSSPGLFIVICISLADLINSCKPCRAELSTAQSDGWTINQSRRSVGRMDGQKRKQQRRKNEKQKQK